jgi:hypothetical protein
MKYWQEYVRSSYELVLEAEGKTSVYLNDDLESYLVRLLARWFDRNDIPPDTPVAIMLMTAMQKPKEQELAQVADICLFYDSFKIKQRRWPNINYYKDMGQIAYGMAYVASNDKLYNQLETKFTSCSKILSNLKVQL